MENLDNISLVSVEMITYKHEGYIKQAIEGVLMQETNFDFELIIADDCSPDDTAKVVEDIIKNHPKGYRIKYFRQATNIGMNANADFAIANCKGKYIAICEGDDYWTDPLKLQKQVDFLESNPEYGLVHTDCKLLYQFDNKFIANKKKKTIKGSHFNALLSGDYGIATLTVCFKKEVYFNYIEQIQPNSKNWLLGDLPLWLYISKFYKIHFINEVTCVYRVLEESASQTKEIDKMMRFETNVREVKFYFFNKYTPNDHRLENRIESLYIYRKIITNAILSGSFKFFLIDLMDFYLINRDLKLFLGTFKQIKRKVFSIITK
jgi:glycosyltransferase involved in cell wall biosynthesis